jgi:hypothetical protein
MLVSVQADQSATSVVKNSLIRALLRSSGTCSLPTLDTLITAKSVATADDRRAKEYRIAS